MNDDSNFIEIATEYDNDYLNTVFQEKADVIERLNLKSQGIMI